MAASSTEQATVPNSSRKDTRRNRVRVRPKTGAFSSEYRASQREIAQKAKAEAEGRTYTKHEKTAQRTAEIVKEDREKARPKELEEYKEGLRDVLSERFGPVRHVTDMTPDQRILQAQTNILENQKKMAQARTDKRDGASRRQAPGASSEESRTRGEGCRQTEG